jgi:hypothetical protein
MTRTICQGAASRAWKATVSRRSFVCNAEPERFNDENKSFQFLEGNRRKPKEEPSTKSGSSIKLIDAISGASFCLFAIGESQLERRFFVASLR